MHNTALLLMDLQRAVVDRITPDPEYLPRLRRAAETARTAGMPVIHVTIGFRPGYPEVSRRNKIFAGIAERGGFGPDEPAVAIHPDIAPQPNDIVVTKRRVSAFAGSDLDMVLRAQEIDTLVLAGIATSGVVLSTVRQAADLDYELVVLSDGCLDADEEVHRVLLEKVFPRQAEISTVDAWIG
jgi:nicotinamidase-related amidase